MPDYEMVFQPDTIDHLGLRLYSTLPPVISELVSNSYDAESPKVEVIFPTDAITEKSEVIIRDFGHAMNPQELQDEYLPIGKNRRGETNKKLKSKNGKVRVTGRKGLGKLSAFGVAEEMDVRSIKDGYAVCLRINYNKLKEWGKLNPNTNFKPEVINERTGPCDEENGVEVRLRRLRRQKAIQENAVRQGLAKRLVFIGLNFEVLVNGNPIQPGDRVKREQCLEGYSWDVSEIPGGGDLKNNLMVHGWLGFHAKSSQVDRGIDIFATNKAVELGSFFNWASTHAQFARAHLVGEIHADFLDGDEDLVATARNSVVWETGVGQHLQEWGEKALIWAFNEWLKLRQKEREQKFITVGGFQEWLKGRTDQERKTADRLVKVLIKDADLEPESIEPLVDIVKNSVETVAFRDLLEVLEEGTAASIVRLFGEWRILEARAHLQLADGRLSALTKLEEFIEKGALEVQELQPLFKENLWIFDPGWNEAYVEASYTKLLKRYCQEPTTTPEQDKRLDIFGVSNGRVATVVELKRPEKTLSRSDLNQIEAYVDWARNNLRVTGPDSPLVISGLLIIGKIGNQADLSDKIIRLAGSDIRVEMLSDLCRRWQNFYRTTENTLKTIAPEYARSARKNQKKKSVKNDKK